MPPVHYKTASRQCNHFRLDKFIHVLQVLLCLLFMNFSLPFLMHITLILKFGIIYEGTLVFLPMRLENACFFVCFQKKWKGRKIRNKTAHTKITGARLTIQKERAFCIQADTAVYLRSLSITCKRGEITSMCSINSAVIKQT